MLKEPTISAPVARSDAASRLLDALIAASQTHPEMPSEADLPAFLFFIDFGAFTTLGKPITDLPWVHHFGRWQQRGIAYPDWILRVRTSGVHSPSERSPGTAFLSGLELQLIRRAVMIWWSFEEPDRAAVRDCVRRLEAPHAEEADPLGSLWDIRGLRKGRESRLRRRLEGLTLAEEPRPSLTDDETEAVAAAVLNTILSETA